MNRISTLVLALALLFGSAGAVLAFQSAAGPGLPAASSTAAPSTPAATPRPVARSGRHPARPRARWAPCPSGTTLVEGACVTDVVRTVTLPAPASATQALGPGTGPV